MKLKEEFLPATISPKVSSTVQGRLDLSSTAFSSIGHSQDLFLTAGLELDPAKEASRLASCRVICHSEEAPCPAYFPAASCFHS